MQSYLILLLMSANHPVASDPSELRPGDGVRYRFSGSYTQAPVLLEERILSRRGLVLEIEVSAARAAERRRWLQVVTDTAANRASNRVDELYELAPDGRRLALSNTDNRDILRLFDWTYPSAPSATVPQGEEKVQVHFSGQPHTCIRSTVLLSWQGRQVRATYHQCPTFPWHQGPGQWQDAQTGEILWQVEVLDTWRADPTSAR